MFGLARRIARRRLAALMASFLAIGLAALVIVVCGGLLETGLRSDVPPQRLRTAPILVAGTQSYLSEPLVERDRLDAGLADRIAAVPGVARTATDVSFPVTALSSDGQPVGLALTGHGWSSAQLTPYTLVDGRVPTSADQAAVTDTAARELRLSVGDRLPVLAGGRDIELRIVGIAKAPAAAGSSAEVSSAVFVTDARAQTLLQQPGDVDLIAVYPAPDITAATLAHRLNIAVTQPGLRVLTGADRGLAEFPDAAGQSANLVPLAGASGGLMTSVAIFIVASTLALSVQLRRRQIALLRAVGTTPGQLRRLVLSETLLLALPAAALALLPSRLLGRTLLAAFADHGLVAHALVYHQSVIPTLAGAGGGVLAGLIAALVAARGAIRVRPVEALSADTAPEPWLGWPRLVFGLIALGGALALALITAAVFDGPIAASTAEPSALLWALAFGLLAPLLVRPLLALFGRLAALVAPRTGRLTDQTVRGRSARTAAVIVPVILATGLSTALLYLQSTQLAATERAYGQHLHADRVLTTSGGQLPLDLAAQAQRLPGVAAASPLVTSTGFFNAAPGTHPDDADSIPLLGLAGPTAAQVANYPVLAGNLSRLQGQTIAVPASDRRPGRELGDTVTLRFGDNSTASLTIVAVIDTPRGYPTLLLPADLLAAHTTTGLADQILVTTTPHASLTTLDAALARLAPGLQVADRDDALRMFARQQQTQTWVGYLFIAALVLYTSISLISTTIAATTQRRPQFRTLRLLGAARHHVVRAMTIEAALVAAVGGALGTLIALATLLPFDSALGTPGLPAGPWWIYPAVIAAATALTILVTRTTTRLLDTRPLAV